jgi:hypothetical protein
MRRKVNSADSSLSVYTYSLYRKHFHLKKKKKIREENKYAQLGFFQENSAESDEDRRAALYRYGAARQLLQRLYRSTIINEPRLPLRRRFLYVHTRWERRDGWDKSCLSWRFFFFYVV